MIRLARYVVTTVVLCASVSSQGQGSSPILFASDRVLEIEVSIAKRDWTQLRLQGRSFESALSADRKNGKFGKPFSYFDASIAIDGVVYSDVGVRKKGFVGSLDGVRPSLKVKLNRSNRDIAIDGYTNLTLNNNKQDVSLISQFLSYQMFRKAGLRAPLSGFAHVKVNGKSLGVYSVVERVRSQMLERAFGDSSGVLYEGTVTDFFPGWELGFERKSGNATRGLARIKDLIALLDESSDRALEAKLAKVIDLDEFYDFWAMESLLGFWDGYTGNKNNYFVYLHPVTNRFHFIPWGADMLFMKYSLVDSNRDVPLSAKVVGLVAYRLYQLESGRKRYAKTLRRMLAKQWDESQILAEVDRLEELLDPYLGRYQRRAIDEMDSLREFVRNRREDLENEIADGMPIWAERPDPPFVMPVSSDTWTNSIWGAARDGNMAALKQFVRSGSDVNETSEQDGSHPLSLAALAGQVRAVRYLLAQGAEVNDTNRKGESALHVAALFGQLEVVEVLLDAGSEIGAKTREGATALNNASLPWSEGLAGVFTYVGSAVGIDFDLEKIKASRPKVAKLLRARGGR